MLTRTQLQQICQSRLDEAKILLQAGKADGAAYIVGYVLETALKARICFLLNIAYPDSGPVGKTFKTHRYDELVLLAGLQTDLEAKKIASVAFKTNWSIVDFWNEAIRYDVIGTNTAATVGNVIQALEDPTDGVLTWIKTVW